MPLLIADKQFLSRSTFRLFALNSSFVCTKKILYLQIKNLPLARQLNTKLTGTKGNLSFYEMDGEYFVRLKSRGGKQTQPTKARQKDFAIAASLSKIIRIILHTAIPNPKQKAMQNRLTKALMEWRLSCTGDKNSVSTIEPLTHFQFIPETPLQTICNVPVTINKKEDHLQIIFPPFKPKQSIKAPEQTKQVHINIAAGRCTVAQRKQVQRIYEKRIITYNNKQTQQQIIELPLKPLQSSVTIVAMSLTFWVKQQNNASLLKVKQKAWSPAAIVFAMSG